MNNLGLLSAFQNNPQFQSQLGDLMNMRGPGAMGAVKFNAPPSGAGMTPQTGGAGGGGMMSGGGGGHGGSVLGVGDIPGAFGFGMPAIGGFGASMMMNALGGANREAMPWRMNQRV